MEVPVNATHELWWSSCQWPDSNNVSIVLTALLAVLVPLIIVTKQKKGRDELKLPPLCSAPFQEFFGNFFGPHGPQYALQVSQRMQSSVYRSPRSLLGLSLYIVCDYATARKVLEDPASTKWSPANQFFRSTTHNGANMITEEGHRWKHVRKSTSTAFSAPNIKRMIESINGIVEQWIQDVLEPAVANKENVAILDEMNRMTSNIIAVVAFDYELSDQEREETLQNLQTCWIEFGQKAGMSLFRQLALTKWLFPGIRRAQRAAAGLYALCQTMLDSYRAKIAADSRQRQPHKIIDLIVHDDEYANDGERIRDCIAFVIAGFDTTANTLAFAFRELARNKHEQTKLRQALLQCKTDDEARNCPELKHVVRETLRMYPAAATGSLRQVGNSIGVADNSAYTIPQGSVVIAPYYAIQRNENVYKNADSFHPSRWATADPTMMRSFMTFSVGRRNCQGQALANAELNEVLAKLIRNYEYNIVEEGEAQNVILFKPDGTILSVKKLSDGTYR